MISNKYFTINGKQYTGSDLVLFPLQHMQTHTTHFYQVGYNAGTYLPNLLVKYANASGLAYKYTWCDAGPNINNFNISEEVLKHIEVLPGRGLQAYTFNLPIQEIENCAWFIYWCADLALLYPFIMNIRKIYTRKYFAKYRFFDHMFILVPSLSNKGTSVSLFSIQHSQPPTTFGPTISKAWEYSYQYDMLATMHMYNITLELLFRRYRTWNDTTQKYEHVYNHVGGNEKEFKIDQSVENLVYYNMDIQRNIVFTA